MDDEKCILLRTVNGRNMWREMVAHVLEGHGTPYEEYYSYGVNVSEYPSSYHFYVDIYRF